MADLVKTFQELVTSNNELAKKFNDYVAASEYDGKKDFNKWLGEFDKALKAVEAALADTKTKLDATNKAFDEFVKDNKEKIEKDKAAMDALRQILAVIEAVEQNIKTIRMHLDQYKA